MMMNEQLAANLKYLRLGGLMERWDEYLRMAAKKRMSHGRLLQHIVEEECRLKRENACRTRLKRARIPELFCIETYPFHRQPKLNKKKVMALYDAFEFIDKAHNIVWMGPTGCGKTGLATSFLVQAITQGYTGRFIAFQDMLDELNHSLADHSEAKTLKRFLRYDCLLIDELGYIEMEPAQVGLFFTLMHKRHKNKATLISTNLGFRDWGTFLKNDHLSAALIDRLTECSHVFNMKDCESLRPPLAQTP